MKEELVHHIDRTTRKLFLVSAFLMLILGAINIILRNSAPFSRQDPQILTRTLPTAMGVLMILIGVMDLWLIRVTRIVTSPAGIGFYSPGFELHTDWANLKKIGSHTVLFGLRKYDCLLLCQPGTQKYIRWISWMTRKVEKEISLSLHRNWRESALGQELKKYAPHLFDQA